MQQNDKMHPEDKRNLIIFGVVSILLWLSYDHFILAPKMEQAALMNKAAQEQAVKLQTEEGFLDLTEKPRADIIDSASAERIKIDNDLVFGTINPVGARLDDLATKEHFKTAERETNAVLLSPSGSFFPKYVEHGWVPADNSITVPDSKKGKAPHTPLNPPFSPEKVS